MFLRITFQVGPALKHGRLGWDVVSFKARFTIIVCRIGQSRLLLCRITRIDLSSWQDAAWQGKSKSSHTRVVMLNLSYLPFHRMNTFIDLYYTHCHATPSLSCITSMCTAHARERERMIQREPYTCNVLTESILLIPCIVSDLLVLNDNQATGESLVPQGGAVRCS